MTDGRITRRGFLRGASTMAAGLAATEAFGFDRLTASLPQALRIGIIGSGTMGGTVGVKWAQAGHQVFFSSRNPDQLADLVATAGPNAQAGVPAAASFGEVVVIAVPYGALPRGRPRSFRAHAREGGDRRRESSGRPRRPDGCGCHPTRYRDRFCRVPPRGSACEGSECCRR